MVIYRLESDSANYSSFIENLPLNKMSIMSKAMGQRWHPFEKQITTQLELRASDSGKKNYNFDISAALCPFYVFSQHAVSILGDILESRGQFLEVKLNSKYKNFIGYYPTNALDNCLCLKNSNYKIYKNGLQVYKPVLIKKNIKDAYLFTIQEDISRVYVTDRFKEIIEQNKLHGFEFERVIEVV